MYKVSKSTCSGTVLLIKSISPLHSHCCHLMVKSVLKLIGPPSWSLSRFPCGMKWLGVLPPIMWHEVAGSITPPPLFDRMLVPHIVISQHFLRLPRQFAGNHLHSQVERGIVRVLSKKTTHWPSQFLTSDLSTWCQVHWLLYYCIFLCQLLWCS